MPRKPRQDPADGWHHITNHAVGSEDLFINDRDRFEFIRRMVEAQEKYNVLVAAFCLMGNHFHLVLHCPDAGTAKFMHYLESIYAREFNMRHGRRGRLFSSEFGDKLIASEGQAIATIRYVHRNPLELAIDIRHYPWSSYRAYLSQGQTAFVADVLVLSNLLGGASAHQTYVETDFDHDKTKMADGTRTIPWTMPVTIKRALFGLFRIASQTCGTSRQEIVAPRSHVRNDARAACTLIAYESRSGFAEELRFALGYRTPVAMRMAVMRARRRLENDQAFARLVNDIRTQWAHTDEALTG